MVNNEPAQNPDNSDLFFDEDFENIDFSEVSDWLDEPDVPFVISKLEGCPETYNCRLYNGGGRLCPCMATR